MSPRDLLRLVVVPTLALMLLGSRAGAEETPPRRTLVVELPGQQSNAIRTSWPGIGCWFWMEEEFKPEGYRRFLDLHAEHSAFRLLTTSIRHPVEVTDPKVHDQIRGAAQYAQRYDLHLVMDLDVRLARHAFQAKYPDEMQEIVRLRQVPLSATQDAELTIDAINLEDHYTVHARGYDSIAGRLLRVYSAIAVDAGGELSRIADITAQCRVIQADHHSVRVSIPASQDHTGRLGFVLAAFTLFTPDVFAPHLIPFERAILEQYRDVPLAGACKDEWGFPGRFGPRPDDLYYSRAMAAAYARRRPRHDLVRDFLLMVKGESGRAAERAAAINHYQEMNRERNAEIEGAFYRHVKATFGKPAMMATHPTWYPYPQAEEVFKNGLDWWASRRDLAQTDEATPFPVRTALAKKWHSPLWYNMYYDGSIRSYEEDVWRAVLGGGRLNFHPLWPHPEGQLGSSLLSSPVLVADARIRLLNLIATAPIDCPVAVVFGHPSALNWTAPGFADVGLAVANGLWAAGYYADLIPSSEIAGKHLRLDADGSLAYGPQPYAAAVLYHPDYERPEVAALFRRAAAQGKTRLYQVGEWTLDFEGNLCHAAHQLPPSMRKCDAAEAVASVIEQLAAQGVPRQPPGNTRTVAGFPASIMPPPAGQCRLLDGTILVASGEREVLGDPIQTEFVVQGHPVKFDAIGVAAVRLSREGRLDAMAAGGLKSFRAGNVGIDLPERIDVAIWHDRSGRLRGVLQGWTGPVPNELLTLTRDWVRLRLPTPWVP